MNIKNSLSLDNKIICESSLSIYLSDIKYLKDSDTLSIFYFGEHPYSGKYYFENIKYNINTEEHRLSYYLQNEMICSFSLHPRTYSDDFIFSSEKALRYVSLSENYEKTIIPRQVPFKKLLWSEKDENIILGLRTNSMNIEIINLEANRNNLSFQKLLENDFPENSDFLSFDSEIKDFCLAEKDVFNSCICITYDSPMTVFYDFKTKENVIKINTQNICNNIALKEDYQKLCLTEADGNYLTLIYDLRYVMSSKN
jgi:hypothetical protein